MSSKLSRALDALPLMAILRGLEPSRAAAIAKDLVAAGFTAIEVPLNGAGATDAISIVKASVPAHVVVGAGTVLSVADVNVARHAGAEFLVSPNLNANVMRAGTASGLAMMPGVFTPSECFAALELGAFALKLFPADALGTAGLKALRSVLPKGQALVYPVSGIDETSFATWAAAGADGFGVGSSLFKPSYSDNEIAERARRMVPACRNLLRTKT